MKIIIAGSRDLFEYEILCKFMNKIEKKYEVTHVISGRSKGMDSCGELWAVEHGKEIIDMPADWSLGKKAGPLRNIEMLKVADIILVIMNDNSKGSSHMSKIAIESGKPTYVYNFTQKKGNKYNVK